MENSIKDIGEACTGCRACEYVCNKSAIKYRENKEGFIYPKVNLDKCVQCGKCRKVCPTIHINVTHYQQKAYAAYLKDEKLLLQSASGGIFAELSLNIIKKRGIIVGCGMDENYLPVHMLVESAEEIKVLQSSKYAQSNMNDIYARVIERVCNGQLVLFSGTPCQVAGLVNLFPDGVPDNLFTCDIICHGVPSRMLLKKYYEWLEKKYQGKLISYNFRSKARNGWSLTYRAEFKCKGNKRKKIENIASIDPYYNSFLAAENYRESCYICPYSQKRRVGDLTIGDFWGIEKEMPELKNMNGVSAVLINTKKGMRLFDEIIDSTVAREVLPEMVFRNNGNLNNPSKRPDCRDSYYDIVNSFGFDFIYMTLSKTKRFKIEKIRNIFSNKTRQNVKKIIRIIYKK